MSITRRPEWLQKKVSPAVHSAMNQLLEDLQLHTVCREAHCPNISECYGNNQATFLILGTICTRLCSFCNVTKRDPVSPDPDEPRRVAEAIQRLHLRHVVITSPTRDDLPDGGAGFYAETVQEIRAASPDTTVELLIPDFQGNRVNLATVVAAHPEILGHNVETVPRLYHVREGADYRRSLRVLQLIVEMDAAVRSKSGLMLGMGETEDEVVQVCADLLAAGCRYLSIGQYLAPSKNHFPVQEYLLPETFDRYREQALAMGFRHVESGPYVRSSYFADKYGE